MRPVNLIPAEDRLGERPQTRTGPLVYILIGTLVLLLGGVALLVQTNNRIAASKADIAQTKTEVTATKAKAADLASYTQFHALTEQRVSTVSTLANSRFDWERVLNELSLVVPEDSQITSLSAKVRPDVTLGSSGGDSAASGSPLRSGVAGPALEIEGCAPGQEGVARFITSLHEIDGVTRVGVSNSAVAGGPDAVGAAGTSTAPASSDSGCGSAPGTAAFSLVVAFDAAPVTAAATAADPTAVVSTTTDPATTTTPTTAPTGG